MPSLSKSIEWANARVPPTPIRSKEAGFTILEPHMFIFSNIVLHLFLNCGGKEATWETLPNSLEHTLLLIEDVASKPS